MDDSLETSHWREIAGFSSDELDQLSTLLREKWRLGWMEARDPRKRPPANADANSAVKLIPVYYDYEPGVSTGPSPSPYLLVEGLSSSTTTAWLASLFEPFGVVLDVSFLRDPNSGYCNGTGQVLFQEGNTSLRAIRAWARKASQATARIQIKLDENGHLYEALRLKEPNKNSNGSLSNGTIEKKQKLDSRSNSRDRDNSWREIKHLSCSRHDYRSRSGSRSRPRHRSRSRSKSATRSKHGRHFRQSRSRSKSRARNRDSHRSKSRSRSRSRLRSKSKSRQKSSSAAHQRLDTKSRDEVGCDASISFSRLVSQLLLESFERELQTRIVKKSVFEFIEARLADESHAAAQVEMVLDWQRKESESGGKSDDEEECEFDAHTHPKSHLSRSDYYQQWRKAKLASETKAGEEPRHVIQASIKREKRLSAISGAILQSRSEERAEAAECAALSPSLSSDADVDADASAHVGLDVKRIVKSPAKRAAFKRTRERLAKPSQEEHTTDREKEQDKETDLASVLASVETARLLPYMRLRPFIKRSRALLPGLVATDATMAASVSGPSARSVAASREQRAVNRQLLTGLSGSRRLDYVKSFSLKSRGRSLAALPSPIQGLGLYSLEPVIPQHGFIVQYVGEVVSSALARLRELRYEQEESITASYFFRLDANAIIDATKKGNLARYINHSCDPNAYAKMISYSRSDVEDEKKILIYARRPIMQGEEITYNYRFPKESTKIKCYCGASNCRGSLN